METEKLIETLAQRSTISGQPIARTVVHRADDFRNLRRLLWALLILILAFSKPLYDLARYALKAELYSHILLIPFISGYLIWLRRDCLALSSEPAAKWAFIPIGSGLALMLAYWIQISFGSELNRNDYLVLTILSFVLFFWGTSLLFLGRDTMRSLRFPLAFLVFMAPFPTFLRDGLEVFFQHTSTTAAETMLRLSGTSLFRDGLSLHMPGMTITVGQECSGIHSSLVLFITGLLAGYFFIQSPWKRTILTFAVIPLGIIRNGIRIFTISQLCIHISPAMIDSPIHHKGGPIFFGLSLVPFFLLLLFLRKLDRRKVGSTFKPATK